MTLQGGDALKLPVLAAPDGGGGVEAGAGEVSPAGRPGKGANRARVSLHQDRLADPLVVVSFPAPDLDQPVAAAGGQEGSRGVPGYAPGSVLVRREAAHFFQHRRHSVGAETHHWSK